MQDLGDLAELPLLAVLATYRRDGTVLLSPVWQEWRDGGFGVVTSSRNVKAGQLRRDPRASIVVCEHSPPYRGIEVRGQARLVTAGARDAVRRIASRYLGREEQAPRMPTRPATTSSSASSQVSCGPGTSPTACPEPGPRAARRHFGPAGQCAAEGRPGPSR